MSLLHDKEWRLIFLGITGSLRDAGYFAEAQYYSWNQLDVLVQETQDQSMLVQSFTELMRSWAMEVKYPLKILAASQEVLRLQEEQKDIRWIRKDC
jgi:hypothetical protein